MVYGSLLVLGSHKSLFLLLFLPLDPDPETRLNPDPIRIRNTANKEEKGGIGERGKAQTGKREWREGQTRKREGRGIG